MVEGRLFSGDRRTLIGVVHLLPTPGSPKYQGSLSAIYERALTEAHILAEAGYDAVIVENFNDTPFYPAGVPPETTAILASVVRSVKESVNIAVGVNVLRNDGVAAVAIAAATDAEFVRINVLAGVAVSEQGVLAGNAHEVLRKRDQLQCDALILADVGVKHAKAIASRGLEEEVRDAVERAGADAIVVSGSRTGEATDTADLKECFQTAGGKVPVLVGSGVTPANLPHLWDYADGFIVGSYLKIDGKATNTIDPERASRLRQSFELLSR